MRSSLPLPIKCSISVTTGLSRKSSVFSLNASPNTPSFTGPSARIWSMARCRCASLLAITCCRSGRSRSSRDARYVSARRSFGRHDPPNAKPGFRYAGEIFRRSSRHSVDITSFAGIFSRVHKDPISLANPIFSA